MSAVVVLVDEMTMVGPAISGRSKMATNGTTALYKLKVSYDHKNKVHYLNYRVWIKVVVNPPPSPACVCVNLIFYSL